MDPFFVNTAPLATTSKGFLGWVERTGNRLPDPVFLFLYLMAGLVAFSAVAALAGISALHPTQKQPDGTALVIGVESLVSAKNVARLWVEMPKTFTHFHPLGYVLVVMLGAGVAERTGLFASAMTLAVRRAPASLLTPMVALVAMIANHAADAAYVVLIPLAGVLYAAAGRHPLAGIAAAFAGVSGVFPRMSCRGSSTRSCSASPSNPPRRWFPRSTRTSRATGISSSR